MEALKHSGEILGKLILTTLIIFAVMFILLIPIMIVGVIDSVASGIDLENAEALTNDLLTSPLMEKTEIFIQAIAFIGAVIIMYAIFERGKGLTLGWKQSNPIKASLVGSGLGIAMMTLAFLSIWVCGGLQLSGVQFDAQVVQGLTYAVFLFAVVAINEELISRGYIQGLIRRRFGTIAAITVTSIIFACLHLANPNILSTPLPLINLFLAGVLFGVCREATGGLWVPIGLHFTWNLFQGNIYGFEVSGNVMDGAIVQSVSKGSVLISGGSFGAEGSILVTLILIVSTIFIWRWYQASE